MRRLPLLLCLTGLLAAADSTVPTFNKDVGPILFGHCSPCHRPGEAGPFPLLTYDDARQRALQLAKVTRSRYMPPWLPEPGYGDFASPRRLSQEQIATIDRWARNGTPEGAVSDLTPAPKFAEGWQLGEPDLIVKLPESYVLPAGGTDVFRNFVLPVPVQSQKFVKAIEIRPGNKRVVHHANLLLDRTGASRRRDQQDPEVGFAGMDVRLESDTFEPDSHFLFWKPGSVPHVEPDDMAWPLEKGTDFVLNMHLQPSGKPETIQPVIGIYFAQQAPTRRPMLLQLEHDGAIDIPAGARQFVVEDSFRLPVDVDVLGVYPHAHYLGKTLEAYATLPGGQRRWLIRIPKWDLNWQAVYPYEKPVLLPKGSVITMHYVYDNSVQNVANPNHPPRRVKAGDRAVDEMGHLWLQVLTRGGDQRPALQQALMEQRLRKYPADSTAHFNLGALAQSRNEAEAAMQHYVAALKSDPDNPVIHNSLGTLLESQRRWDEAVQHFLVAIRQRPDYLDARYNLANTLALQNRLPAAIEQFRQVVAGSKEDQAARERLSAALQLSANALIEGGRLEEAISLLEEAAQTAPEADLLNNLGTLLARKGRKPEAAERFRQALQLEPQHEAARRNLARVTQ